LLKLLEVVYDRKFDMCPMIQDDYQPARDRENRHGGERQERQREPVRDATQDELA
jgi:hypothetical protein